MSDAAQTTADFLRAVRASGLVEAEKLDPVVAPWNDAAGPLPDDLVAALVDRELLTTWQVDQLRRGRHKGFVLGKYKLLRLLGTGGMSSVYLAEHSTLHNKVAIKVLPVKRVDQSSYLARFEREAQASARLNHPHIARAFDLDTSGTIHFIVMEFIDGEDLHARVKEGGPLPVRDTAEFIRQAALGLQYAHDEGLVHRDIKPANLIVDKRGHLKILDLGLALADAEDDEDASLTREHDEKVLGTADYLAPEQARDSHKADRRSDIYSLGCTLFYLLVGKPPFHKGTLAQRIRAHLNDPAPNILDFRADVPPAIAELYFRMMEKHPDARQQTAQEVADALSAWLATNPTTPSRGRAEPPPRRSDMRRGNPQASVSLPRRSATAGDGSDADSSVGSGIGGEPGSASGSGSGPGSSAADGSQVQPGGSSISRGRDGSGRRSGSGIDPQSLSLTPPPSSPARSTARLPQLGRPAAAPSFPGAPTFPAAAALPAAPGGGIKIDVAGGAAARQPQAPKPAAKPETAAPRAAAIPGKLGRKLYGLPLLAWLGIGGVVLAAAGLGAWLFLAGAEEPSKGESSRSGTATKKPVKKEETPPVRRRRSTSTKKPGETTKPAASAAGS